MYSGLKLLRLHSQRSEIIKIIKVSPLVLPASSVDVSLRVAGGAFFVLPISAPIAAGGPPAVLAHRLAWVGSSLALAALATVLKPPLEVRLLRVGVVVIPSPIVVVDVFVVPVHVVVDLPIFIVTI